MFTILDRARTCELRGTVIAASLAVMILYVITLVTDISRSRHIKPCISYLPDMVHVHPKASRVTPDPSLCNSKSKLSSKDEREPQNRSIGLILRSDLLGNVQGTAHITCSAVSIAPRVKWSDSAHLSLAISPEIYTASDEVIQRRICSLV